MLLSLLLDLGTSIVSILLRCSVTGQRDETGKQLGKVAYALQIVPLIYLNLYANLFLFSYQ